MINRLCVVTFFYPGIEKKINIFIKSLEKQFIKNFDLVIFFNNKKNFRLPKNNLNIKIFKLNTSIIKSRFKMFKKLKTLNYKYIIFQDADDLMSQNRIKICEKLLQKYNVVINDLDIYGKKIIKKYFSKRIKVKTMVTAKDIADYNFCGMSNTSIRSECLKKIKMPINHKIKIFDWYFWTIILSKYKGYFDNTSRVKYFVKKRSITRIPNKYSEQIALKILNIKKSHKNEINKLIKEKKIKNFNIFNGNKIFFNKNYNFWWE